MSQPTWEIRQGDVLDRLRKMPDESVHCMVTSPPYWGLRDYGLSAGVWGGDSECEHEWAEGLRVRKGGPHGGNGALRGGSRAVVEAQAAVKNYDAGSFCQLCGAWCGCLGLEPTPELYVEHMSEVFGEVRRVLRADGTLWLNMGDCYATGAGRVGDHPGGGAQGDRWKARGEFYGGRYAAGGIGPATQPNRMPIPGLKPKDLVGMPWRVAFALQADGWYLRSDIIWAKPNPMPESVRDRPTKSHEYLFLVTKRERYFYDAEAIAELAASGDAGSGVGGWAAGDGSHAAVDHATADRAAESHGEKHPKRWTGETRNRRTVWGITTKPYSAAHFATFPPELPELCIKAGTSEAGCCAECGAPWERGIEVHYENPGNRTTNGPRSIDRKHEEYGSAGYKVRLERRSKTIGWSPTCRCNEFAEVDREDEEPDAPLYPDPIPCTVLDPFAGSGTTLMVALRLGRDAIGIELNPEYVTLAENRIDSDCPLFNRTPA